MFSKSNLKLSYSEDSQRILVYGDPSIEHERFSLWLHQRLVSDLQEFISSAPSTGLPHVDAKLPKDRTDQILWNIRSTSRVLVPFLEKHRTARHPTDSTRNGTIHKAPDYLLTASPFTSATEKPMDILVVEVAFKNESLAEALWEAQRWTAAQTPARISLVFKIQVSLLSPRFC
jgi:hypothetical protein